MSANPTSAQRPASIARERVAELRKLVDDARAAGARLDGMVLQVTQRDEALLKRSSDVAVSELSFADGETRFLGVKVVRSDAVRSSLQSAAAA